MIRDVYVVIGRRGWNSPKIVKITKREPKLQVDQRAFRLRIDIPNNILDMPAVDVAVNLNNLIYPKAKVTQP